MEREAREREEEAQKHREETRREEATHSPEEGAPSKTNNITYSLEPKFEVKNGTTSTTEAG